MADKALETVRRLIDGRVCECGHTATSHEAAGCRGWNFEQGKGCDCQSFRPVRFEVRRGWQPLSEEQLKELVESTPEESVNGRVYRELLARRAADPTPEQPLPVLAITVWRFRDAPAELRELSGHGGDEDWLAVVPPALRSAYIPWLESGRGFGYCEVSEHEQADGSMVYIGAHA